MDGLFAVPTVILGLLLWHVLRAHDVERLQWVGERSKLIQRIQAPEVAVIRHDIEAATREMPAEDPVPPLLDDEGNPVDEAAELDRVGVVTQDRNG
jgi:hypothetical protein